MKKQCHICSREFTISDKDQEFYGRVKAPSPSTCPMCRMQRRMAYRNERRLFADECDSCHKRILSMYHPDDQFTVYCSDCWWSDTWEPTDYGKEINWDTSLIEQWNDVRRSVPRLAVVNMKSENSDYTNMAADNKNCYLLFAAENNENCSYGKLVQNCKDCFDCNFIYQSELCYMCVDVRNCYRSMYLLDSQDSRECGFSVGLRGCSNVFLSSNLHNKEYFIANKPVDKEQYKKRVAEYLKNQETFNECIQKWQNISVSREVKYTHSIKSDGCTGDYLTNCKRCYDCFDVDGGQDCRFVTDALDPKDTYDASFIYYQPELVYDSMSMLKCYNVQYSIFAYYTSDSQYCDQVHNSKNLLLSSCVKKGENMILNKAYSAEEFLNMRKKVIEKMINDNEYGELPEMKHSLFRYNDTVAQEYYPLSKEEAMSRGLRWNDEDFSKKFNITKVEKAFYSEMGLPEPKDHPEVRHQWRMKMRNDRKLSMQTCAKCESQFQTTYQKNQSAVILCERCYNSEYF